MFHTSYIELSQSALNNNIRFLKELIGPEVKLSSVVKGNAYGHGLLTFIPMALEAGIDHFSVYSANEALEVFEKTWGEATIMIMGMIENEEIEWAVEHDVEFFVFEMERLEWAIHCATKLGKPAKVHLEFETGMNRTGFIQKELSKAVRKIKKHPEQIEVVGACTHFAGAESVSNYLRVKKQFSTYNRALKWLQQRGITKTLRHAACSAAMVRYPKSRLDMVRVGIMQYGLWPNPETFIEYIKGKPERIDPLKRVISWKSYVMSVKEVEAGEFIGYGNSYLAQENMKIAVVPVGYSHGFSRSLSNQGRALINGKQVKVVGTINMNATTMDVSHLDDVKKGDTVTLIGTENDLSVSVSSFSELSEQLNYELLTRLPMDIPRTVVD